MQLKERPIRPRRAPLVGAGVPARDMTPEVAIEWLVNAKVLRGPIGEPWVVDGRVTIAEELDGVALEYCSPKGCKPQAQSHLDPRFAVYLVRLARMLRERFGATAIRHYGMWPAGQGQPSHDAGIAIDLAGVVTPQGYISVFNDWGSKPKNANGYRLSPGDRGYELFRTIYAFTSAQGDDRSDGGATELGEQDSFIRHPDLHDIDAAYKHRDHMHLQAGQVQTGKGAVSLAPPAPSSPGSSSSSSSNGMTRAVVGIGILGLLGGGAVWYLNRPRPSGGGSPPAGVPA